MSDDDIKYTGRFEWLENGRLDFIFDNPVGKGPKRIFWNGGYIQPDTVHRSLSFRAHVSGLTFLDQVDENRWNLVGITGGEVSEPFDKTD